MVGRINPCPNFCLPLSPLTHICILFILYLFYVGGVVGGYINCSFVESFVLLIQYEFYLELFIPLGEILVYCNNLS